MSDFPSDGATRDFDPNATTAEAGAGDARSVRRPDGRYRVLRFHARGGLGEVFVAVDTELGREVALKRIRAERAGGASTERFVREAEITSRLEHPGVVPVYGLIRDGERPEYAMRFVAGDTLLEAIARFHASGEPFEGVTFRGLLGRFVATCNAVAYAHSRGVIHRDLKPANVMLGAFGETLVVDWGLALEVGAGGSGEGVVGTPAYMPTEQARGEAVGPLADVYALGATLHHLLAGRPPASGATAREILARVASGDLPSPRAANPRVPKPLDAIARRAMAAPADRYPDAIALAAEVEQWLADEPVAAYREPLSARARRWTRKHRTLVTTAVAALVLTAIGLSVGVALLTAARERERAAKEDAQRHRRAAREAFDTVLSEDALGWMKTQERLLPEQKAFLTKALTKYQAFATDAATDEEGRALVALAHFRAGYLFHLLGQRDAADGPYRAALAAYETLADDYPATRSHRRMVARSHNNLGLLLCDSGKLADATSTLEKCLKIARALAGEIPDEPAYRSELAIGHNSLASVLWGTGNLAGAEAAFRDAATNWQKLADAAPGDESLRAKLAESHHNLGMVLRDRGQYTAAESECSFALVFLQPISDDGPTAANAQRIRAGCLDGLGAVQAAQKKWKVAEESHRAALAIQRPLADDYPSVPEYRRALARTLHNLGDAAVELKNPKDAETAYREALTIQTKLADRFSAVVGDRWELASSHVGLGRSLANQGRSTDAEAAYRTALAVLGHPTAGRPSDSQSGKVFGRCCNNLGVLWSSRNDHVESVAWFTQAIDRLQPLHSRGPRDATTLVALINSYVGRANSFDRRHKWSEAAADWATAIELAGPNAPSLIHTRWSGSLTGAGTDARAMVAAGQPARAFALVEQLVAPPNLPPKSAYDLAAVCAVCAAAPGADRDRYAAKVVDLLKRAVATGFKNTARLLADADFDALWFRDDFRRLLTELKVPPPEPLPPPRPAP